MKPNELRIGNLITEKNKVKVVSSSDLLVLQCLDYGCYDPILLTEEILLKCGFENDENLCFRFFLDLDPIEITIFAPSLRSDLGDNSIKLFDRWLDIEIEYLHQLQNLYFALTGKELKITL